MPVKKKNRGLKSLRVLRQRRISKREELKLKQKKTEFALKTELMHRLDVQLSANDAVEVEVAPNVLADFLVVLEDPAITSLYDFEQDVGQGDDSLFIFRSKNIL